MLQTINFQVSGEQILHCAGCKERVSRVLSAIPGVQNVQASVQTQQVQVELDSTQVSPLRVQTKLEQLGYEFVPQGAAS